MPNTEQITNIHPSVHQANNSHSLNQALTSAQSGDTIVITQPGDYGTITLRDISAIRIKAQSKHLSIRAKISIEGTSSKLIIENINLWHNHQDGQPLIQISEQSKDIVIRYCLFSSTQVQQNTLRKNHQGNPAYWLNGIVIKGSHCQIFNNTFVNLRSALRCYASDIKVKNNIIQYFSKNAIRLSGNHSQIIDNHIYSPVNRNTKQQTAIKLFSTKGLLNHIQIQGNTIKTRHSKTIDSNLQSQLAAITALDGYFTQLQIVSNTIDINSEHAITINGAFALSLKNNSISSTPQQDATGIRIYLTRKKISKNNYQWLTQQRYSISFNNNHAAYVNIASEYQQQDLGENYFSIRESYSSYASSGHKDDEEEAKKPVEKDNNYTIHTVENKEQLIQAIHKAEPNDSIILNKHGHYGDIHITNKKQLRITSLSKQLPMEINFIINGNCCDITLDNIQIWNKDLNSRYLVIVGRESEHITISNCILSTHPVIPERMLERFTGEPDQWISGLRILGANCHVTANTLVNLKSAVLETGPNNRVDSNLIQFYSEDAVRASNHGVQITKNQIFDSVSAAGNKQAAHKDAIQLIPPKDRFEGGELRDVQILDNMIKNQSHPLSIPEENRGIVQGIFASDGYFVNTRIENNTIMVNSDHGITINGVHKMQCHNNEVINMDTSRRFQPGIKFYLTRASTQDEQRWLLNKEYSVSIASNVAPVLNIPDQAYTVDDNTGNQFKHLTHAKGRGKHIFDDDKAQSTDEPQTYKVHDQQELQVALSHINDGDELIFEEPGTYGAIKLHNKQNIAIKGRHRDILINAHIVLDGHCKNINISNLSLWFSKKSWYPIVLTGPATEQITIENCFISSAPTTRQDARQGYTGDIADWTTGIWSRGLDCKIINTHITNVRSGIILNGNGHTLQNNLVQYFVDTGVRIMSDDNTLLHNNIYDSIEHDPNRPRLATGIQLIPFKGRFEGGLVSNLKISNTIIQQKSRGSLTNEEDQSKLQGISLHDGHLVNAEIIDNTIVVDTEHGIIINGGEFIELHGNRIFDSEPQKGHTPGIRFFLTRTIDLNNNRRKVWHSGLNYSVRYSHNEAAILNMPSSSYVAEDLGNNTFRITSHNRARGVSPIIEP